MNSFENRIRRGVRGRLFAVSLLLATLLSACGRGGGGERGERGESRGTPTATPRGAEPLVVSTIEPGAPGGQIVVGTVSSPTSFNPFVANDGASIEIIFRIFDGLVELDCATGEYRPALASRWEVSPDGRRWTFVLRRGVLWADGTPFTADDVLWNFRVLYDDSVEATSREIFSLDESRSS